MKRQIALTVLVAVSLAAPTAVRSAPLGEYWGTAEREAEYYRIVEIPFPEEMAVEAGSFEVLPGDRIAIGTRRGEILIADGVFGENPKPTFKTFASGLDEVTGLAYRDGAFIVTQQTEVSRISDVDGDGRADRFDTLSDAWGFRKLPRVSLSARSRTRTATRGSRSASPSRTAAKCRSAAGA